MKTLKNIISTVLILSCTFFVLGQNTEDGFCNQYVENESSRFYNDPLETKFFATNSIDSTSLNIIICTYGSVTSLFHVKVVDSTICYFDYIYEGDKFILKRQEVLIHSVPKGLDKINGFYQYWSCHSKTDKFSKCLSVYSQGILKSRIMFEGVEYPNSDLPKTEKLKDLFWLVSQINK